jgi:hypothetical protein
MNYFKSYKGRSITDGQRVKVYFNLHNKKFSAVALDGSDKGRVLGHFGEVVLTAVSFVVSETGRQRVLREKKKNVHAYAIGTLYEADQHGQFLENAKYSCYHVHQIRYNPYEMKQFEAMGVPVVDAPWAYLGPKGAYTLGANKLYQFAEVLQAA